MSLSILTVQPSDLDIVLDMYDEGARWLREQGLPAGPDPQPDWVRENVAADIAAGCVYFARDAEGPVLGTLRLLWSDPVIWPRDKDEAGYVHGLFVRNAARGRGVGAALLAWAEQTVRARGRRYLRLDCDVFNLKLRAYYERLGFKPADVMPTLYYIAARFEKEL